MYTFDSLYIPNRMMPGIRRYVDNGVPPGRFLTAIICNDLSRAVSAADYENIRNIPAFSVYFRNEVPSGCWGSIEKFRQHIDAKEELLAKGTEE